MRLITSSSRLIRDVGAWRRLPWQPMTSLGRKEKIIIIKYINLAIKTEQFKKQCIHRQKGNQVDGCLTVGIPSIQREATAGNCFPFNFILFNLQKPTRTTTQEQRARDGRTNKAESAPIVKSQIRQHKLMQWIKMTMVYI